MRDAEAWRWRDARPGGGRDRRRQPPPPGRAGAFDEDGVGRDTAGGAWTTGGAGAPYGELDVDLTGAGAGAAGLASGGCGTAEGGIRSW